MAPSRGRLFGADPRAMAIRNLIAEAEALPAKPVPVAIDGVLTRRKTEAEYNRDQRRAHLLERAAEVGLLRSPEDEIRDLRAGTTWYGEDHPILNTMRWMGSFPAAAGAAGQMLANTVDPEGNHYPNAYRDFAKNVNNMAGILPFGEPMGVNNNHMRDMQDMRDEMARMPIGLPPEANAEIRQKYAQLANPKSSSEILREAHSDDLIGSAGTRLLGGTMDYVFDPTMWTTGGLAAAKAAPKGLGAAAKAFMGGAFPTTARNFAVDYGLGSWHETLPLAIDAANSTRDYINPPTNIPY